MNVKDFVILLSFLTSVTSCGRATSDIAKQLSGDDVQPPNEVRLTGTLATNFGSSGIVSTGLGTDFDSGQRAIIDSDGSIFVGGTSFNFATFTTDLVLWKFSPDGTLDTSFGEGTGRVTHHLKNETVYDMAIDSSGNIILVGETNHLNTLKDLAIWKLTPTGALDTSFGSGNGYVIHSNAAGAGIDGIDIGFAVAIDSSDNIIVSGVSNFEAATWKYTPSGNLHPTFAGGQGYFTSATGYICHDIVLDSSDSIYVATSQSSELAVWKLDSDGVFDSTFDGDGVFLFSGSNNSLSLTLDSNENIIVVGTDSPDIVILKLTLSGELDTSFAGGLGYVNSSGTESGTPSQVLLDANGDIIILGKHNNGSDDDAIIWKYTSTGQPDSTFASGNAYTKFNNISGGSGSNDEFLGGVISSEGALFSTGKSFAGGTDDDMILIKLE
ncbi:MAG: hypothetical protein CME64_08010 [Halobacteriovoraceae bacterium]|nr:hypothetical protein [Halobacteriovoraceae bacterium]|tara:strand:+ start:150483 stop:151799 length:1317 start_codon:yes stop_codon:yes gene_type:complete